MNEEDFKLYYYVKQAVSENPEWISIVMSAANAGITKALDDAKKNAATKEDGMLAALTLVRSSRITEEVKERLVSVIAKAITAPMEIKNDP